MTRIKIGATIPLHNSSGNVSTTWTGELQNNVTPVPHMYITSAPNNNDDFLANPNTFGANVPYIKFDSLHFNYLTINQSATYNETFAAIEPTTTFVADTSKKGGGAGVYYPQLQQDTITREILYHGLGYVPAFFVDDTTGSNALSTSTFYGSGGSWRTVNVVCDSTRVYIKMRYSCYTTRLPEFTVTGRAHVLKMGLTDTFQSNYYENSTYGLSFSDNRVILGQGKFDSNRKYLYVDPAGYKMVVGRAYDNRNGSYFLVNTYGYQSYYAEFRTTINGTTLNQLTNNSANYPDISYGDYITLAGPGIYYTSNWQQLGGNTGIDGKMIGVNVP